MIEIRYLQERDKEFWFKLDQHLTEQEFERKVRDQMGYVLLDDDTPVALLRYNLFWDNTPFCTLLFVDWGVQRKGYGKALMMHWEADMKEKGYRLLMTSTQVDEDAQHFYRKLGYQDAGGMLFPVSGFEQPMELFFLKAIE